MTDYGAETVIFLFGNGKGSFVTGGVGTLPTSAPTLTPTPTFTPTPTIPLFCDPTPCPSGYACVIHPPFQSRVCACAGSCQGDQVNVQDLVLMVNVALGNAGVSTCAAGDVNGDGQISVDEILQAVNNALEGCPGPTPTPSPICIRPGNACLANADCCSRSCVSVDGVTLVCQDVSCTPSGSPCDVNTDCCSGSCISPDGVILVCQ